MDICRYLGICIVAILTSILIVIFAPMMDYEVMGQRNMPTMESDLKTTFTTFLQQGRKETIREDGKYYEDYFKIIKDMVENNHSRILVIGHQDFINYSQDLAQIVFESYYKYEPLLNLALTQFIKELERGQSLGDNAGRDEEIVKYYVTFNAGNEGVNGVVDLRDLKSHRLGKLTCMRGTVTKTTEVRPELISGVFRCRYCNRFSKEIYQQFKYTEPKKCYGNNCDSRSWELDIARSDFSDFQKLRIQEDPGKIPPGAMPRSIDVILRDENVQKAQPGDICKFIGYLCVLPEISSMLKPGEKTTVNTQSIETRGNMMEMEGVQGVKGIRELNYKFIYVCTNVIVENNQFNNEASQDFNEKEDEQYAAQDPDDDDTRIKYDEDKIYEKVFGNLTHNQIENVMQLKNNSNLYSDLAESLFPGIFGHMEIKKSLLLQLFSGIHKVTTRNKINIRGDINILIVGDPSTAKSQFLKCVNKFVPRSVYTNGKTTSAAGLTATVTRDQNGNVGIQAGALMLADNGICCIDEFDKMDSSDQTAIHQAMEQQTISIAKAGVQATLNARTSVLAAANPLFGRYDKSKNLKQNLNISPPIMSRFDLFFIVCDESNDAADSKLCEFLINMHREKERAIVKKYDYKTLRMYIALSRKIFPRMNLKAAERLRQCYKILRAGDKTLNGISYRVTVRQLESMIRLSQAIARLHLSLQIKEQYVEEAFRLISSSILKLQKPDIHLEIAEYETEKEKENNQKVKNAMEALQKKKIEESKGKKLSLSYETYCEYMKDIMELFKRQKKQKGSMNYEIQLTQGNVINYIIATAVERGDVNVTAEEVNLRKIVRAILKKMVKDQRMLMILTEGDLEDDTVLKVHPNFNF